MPLASSFIVNFTVPWGTDPFPVPLKEISPLGGLAYQGSVDNVITGSGEVDTYTLALLGNQTLAVLVTPVSSVPPADHYPVRTRTEQSRPPPRPPRASRLDPRGAGPVNRHVHDPGLRRAAGTIGEYKIQAVLNARRSIRPLMAGRPTAPIGTAHRSTPTPRRSRSAPQRVSVLGTITGSAIESGDVFVAARYNDYFEVDRPLTDGAVVMNNSGRHQGPIYGGLSGVEEDPDNNTSTPAVTTGFNGDYATRACWISST